MKKILINFVILIIIIGAIINIIIQNKNYNNHLYGMTAIVINISKTNDTVTIKDYNNNLWQFKKIQNWKINDIVACIMDSNDTESIKDDEIVSIKYNGHLEGWN